MKPYRGMRVLAFLFRHAETKTFSRKLYQRARMMGLKYVRAHYVQEGELHSVAVSILDASGNTHRYRFEGVTPSTNFLKKACRDAVQARWSEYKVLLQAPEDVRKDPFLFGKAMGLFGDTTTIVQVA